MKAAVILVGLILSSSAHASSAMTNHKGNCSIWLSGPAGPLGPIKEKAFTIEFAADPDRSPAQFAGSFEGNNYLISVNTKNAAAGGFTVDLFLATADQDTAKTHVDVMGYYDGSPKVTNASVERQHDGKTVGMICNIYQN